MKRNKYCPIMIFLLFFKLQLQAQEIKKISLQEAVTLGLQHSRYLQMDKAKIEEAHAVLLGAQNNQLPDFNWSASYMRLTNAKVDMKMKTGNANSNSEPAPTINQAMIGMASLSLPLYAGHRIKYDIARAKLGIKAAELDAETDQNTIAFTIANAFAGLFKFSKSIAVLKENLTASQQRDSMFLRLEENGIIARNDRLKAQLQTANIELQLLDAGNQYTTALMRMNLLLGLPDETQLIPDSSFIQTGLNNQPLDYFEALSLTSRKDLQSLNVQQKAAGFSTRAAKAQSFPALSLSGGYVAANIPHFISVYNAVNLGVGIHYNLANLWKKNATLLQSRAKEKQLSALQDELTDNIKLALHKDYQNALFAGKKTLVYERALEQSSENFRITQNKYKNSLVTITDLLDADAALLAAKINLVNSRADAALAYFKLLETAGVLPTAIKK